MNNRILRRASCAVAAALATTIVPGAFASPVSVYESAPFQGVTFTFKQVDADTLTFNISGTLGGDWATAKYLGAFDLKDLGVNFTTTTATLNGPGASNVAGVNDQLSGANVMCTGGGSPSGGVCFNISPDFAVDPMPMDLTYTIDFSSPLNIDSSLGPHLQIAWLGTAGATKKVGSLYSENIALSGTETTTSTGTVPEPGSVSLAVLALALCAGATRLRRQA
jgi:hypothetical protein